MKKVVLVALIITLLLFLLPLVIPGPGRQAEQGGETPPTGSGDWGELTSGTSLRVLVAGQVQEMDLNEYIWGVVAAEMPASFEGEALKAQAVAARTYAMRRAGVQKQNHPDADVCGDHTCCQAYIAPERAAENWGDNAASYKEKIRKAVAETGTEVIVYDGALIDAVFHSSSAEMTLDAVEVWGGTVPYLQAVESPEGDEVPNYRSEVVLAAEDFKSSFLAAHPEAVLEGAPSGWFGESYRTAAGSVSQITVGGVVVRGTEVRTLCKLRSAAFTVDTNETQVIFRVVGYGHGVGMSQYGANSMAKDGKTYRDILTWYYTGVEVQPCPGDLLPS